MSRVDNRRTTRFAGARNGWPSAIDRVSVVAIPLRAPSPATGGLGRYASRPTFGGYPLLPRALSCSVLATAPRNDLER